MTDKPERATVKNSGAGMGQNDDRGYDENVWPEFRDRTTDSPINRLFVIGDLHLSPPWDPTVYHPLYRDHPKVIATNWAKTVGENDVVIVLGDISFARTLDAAIPDLDVISSWRGEKWLMAGNHDHWWFRPEDDNGPPLEAAEMAFVERDLNNFDRAVVDFGVVENGLGQGKPAHVVAGSVYGAVSEQDPYYEFSWQKEAYIEELERTKAVVQTLVEERDRIKETGRDPVTMICYHVPPCTSDGDDTEMTDEIEENGINICAYGHFHLKRERDQLYRGVHNGTKYELVAMDNKLFKLTDMADIAGLTETDGKGTKPTSKKRR